LKARKKFYAFKQKVGALVQWAVDGRLDGVKIWAATGGVRRWDDPGSKATILYVRIDDVDFSFHAIPGADAFLNAGNNTLTWSGARLKPIAPIVLAWARSMRRVDTAGSVSSAVIDGVCDNGSTSPN
jgi:hypothetical protein